MQIKNLKVLELASVLAGPSVGMFFAELGAEVVKIESKKSGGDVTRSWKLPEESHKSTISAYYSSVNWNKEVVFLDYLNGDDRNTLEKFISRSDIIIVNFKAGDAEKFNLTFESILQVNSKIIYASINGYGEGNTRSAFDVVLQAETGFLSMTGTESSGPVKMPVALIDLLAAHQLKEGILVALAENKIPSKVSVSLYDTAIASPCESGQQLFNG